jgi:hypothetical protein
MPDNIFSRMIARIDAALAGRAQYNEEDRRVLTYIRSQITPKGQERRPELYKAVDHLMEVAHQRLRPYENRKVL